ncbi:MAG: hypothetical protein MZV63_34000 [Marinilabiliales bacterium]|nr:hypothetical protein [Marinilabiliales bacterium]
MAIFRQFRPVFLSLGGIIMFNGALRATLILFLPVYLISGGENLWFAGISLAVLQVSGAIEDLHIRIGFRQAWQKGPHC